MKKVIAAMTLITAAAIYGAASLLQFIPSTISTAVIAERNSKSVGGGIAVLLPKNLSEKQHQLLNLAYKIAKEEGIQPEIVQGILLQETLAGGLKSYKVANPGPEAYFGPMQIKLAATRDVLNRHPQLYSKYDFHTRSDDEVKANLILNEEFNLRVGTKYLVLLQKQYGFTGLKLANAYNRGPGGVHGVDDSFHYALGAQAKLSKFKQKR